MSDQKKKKKIKRKLNKTVIEKNINKEIKIQIFIAQLFFLGLFDLFTKVRKYRP